MNEDLNIEATANEENKTTVVMETITDRNQVIARLQEIVNDITLAGKAELEHLKQGFYKLLHSEQEAKKAKFLADGGKAEDYTPETDELEVLYKKLVKIIKEKRAAQLEAMEIIKKENLKKKYELLETEYASLQNEHAELLNKFEKINGLFDNTELCVRLRETKIADINNYFDKDLKKILSDRKNKLFFEPALINYADFMQNSKY